MTSHKPVMPRAADPQWYKDAIIYQLHVKAFCDSNGDGYGDFRGLTEKLDYIQDLGVTAVWLLPFYPSPLRDDGYDIADYRNVHRDYGTMRDFRRFVREAHRRGLAVITELVVNHTSDQHPWFQAARNAKPGSARRNWYVWSDDDRKYTGTRIIFTDTETSNWAWDPVAKQYYWHRFFSHQPDLNYDNPQVRRAVVSAMSFWLETGVDGMRLDAIPYLCEREGTNNENLPETHEVLKELRAELDKRFENRMFLAEANQWPEDVRPYFGDGDECHMAFHFPLMPRIYMAVAQEDRHPVIEIMEQTPEIPDSCQWAIFLRNHDELTLEMVTDSERDYMYQVYAIDPRMRINVGIRRRLAPLMDNDLDKVKLLYSLLMSMPGSPILYYGDEIGMGDNIYLGDRDGVRTPMQWSPDRNAGFSRADPQKLYLPPVMDPVYGYQAVNVESQSRDPSSMLNWMKRLIAVRKAHPAFGRGSLEFLEPGNRKILALVREHDGDIILCVANLSRSAEPVELDLSRYRGLVPMELMGRSAFPPIGELPYLLTLPGHGFYWFRLADDIEVPRWHEERLPHMELPVLVMLAGWSTLTPDRLQERDPQRAAMARRVNRQLEDEVWPSFLGAQRWFAGKDERITRVQLTAHCELTGGGDTWLLAIVKAETARGREEHYFMPMAQAWESEGEERMRGVLHRAMSRIRRGPSMGLLFDAMADEGFCRCVLRHIAAGDTVTWDGGELRFRATARFEGLLGEDPEAVSVRGLGAEQSNTSVIAGERAVLKAYRRLQTGVNPEVEVGRFLTEHTDFTSFAAVAGYIEHADAGGGVTSLAVLQEFVANQGDGWNATTRHLGQLLDSRLLGAGEEEHVAEMEAFQDSFLALIERLGLRTGELHAALATRTGQRAFDPEPVSAADTRRWCTSVAREARATLSQLERRRTRLPRPVRQQAQALLGRRRDLEQRIAALDIAGADSVKSRFHGDFHLGQVLVVQNDFVIVDFEGEPARSLRERRRKHSPLRDVAGMLRSFDYAASSALMALGPEFAERHEECGSLLRQWEERASRHFLAGYVSAVARTPVCPGRFEDLQPLIDLFQIEKALYEIRYEVGNRPDWTAIPLAGVLRLIGDDTQS